MKMKIQFLFNIILLIILNNKSIIDFFIIYIFTNLTFSKYRKSFILLIFLFLNFIYIFNIKKIRLTFFKLILFFNSLSFNN